MINYHEDLYTTLNNILPTYYELFLSENEIPCISYMEISNADSAVGDTLGYSKIRYQIKVWGKEIAQIQQYTLEIDKALKPLGWKRISSNEMTDNQSLMIQKILTYEAEALEIYQ